MKTTNWRKATYEQICKLDRDNFSFGDFWIITDATTVSLAAQKLGESATQTITLPRRVFSRFVDEYLKERNIK